MRTRAYATLGRWRRIAALCAGAAIGPAGGFRCGRPRLLAPWRSPRSAPRRRDARRRPALCALEQAAPVGDRRGRRRSRSARPGRAPHRARRRRIPRRAAAARETRARLLASASRAGAARLSRVAAAAPDRWGRLAGGLFVEGEGERGAARLARRDAAARGARALSPRSGRIRLSQWAARGGAAGAATQSLDFGRRASMSSSTPVGPICSRGGRAWSSSKASSAGSARPAGLSI